MSTIDKCCEISNGLVQVFEQIKKVNVKSFDKNKTTSSISQQDKKKILKLFNYDKWQGYIKWIDEKLEQSGQGLDSFLQASGVESLEPTETHNMQQVQDSMTTKKQGTFKDDSMDTQIEENEYKLLQRQNKKLKNMNTLLNKKYEQLKRTYSKIMK